MRLPLTASLVIFIIATSMVKLGVQGAAECGEFEEWFNYRLSRAAPETCAPFLGSFVADKTNTQFTKGEKWLVWKYEGDLDLADYMKDRSFPLNLESVMFGRVLKGADFIERNALIIKQILRQIITSLKKIHDTGIVHRDVKSANLVVTKKGQIKLIDFGAAADLCIGKNYVPDRGLLDPDYCPPELYTCHLKTPDGGCLAVVLRTGFETTQGKLMRTILFSSERCQSQFQVLYAEGNKGCVMEFSAYNLLCVILHSNNNRELLSAMSSINQCITFGQMLRTMQLLSSLLQYFHPRQNVAPPGCCNAILNEQTSIGLCELYFVTCIS